MKKISQNDFAEATKSGITVIDFFATWCGLCKMSAPYLEDMSEKLEGKVDFYKVNVDEEQELTAQQKVTGMPTFIVFNDGKPVEKIVGADLKKLWATLQELIGE